MNLMDKLLGWKTIIVGVVLTGLQIYRSVKPTAAVPDDATATHWIDWVLDASGPIMIVMRLFTKTPVGGPKTS